eukprot:scaffold347267_cov33-Prasinocladus_malaysianus.AAC.1
MMLSYVLGINIEMLRHAMLVVSLIVTLSFVHEARQARSMVYRLQAQAAIRVSLPYSSTCQPQQPLFQLADLGLQLAIMKSNGPLSNQISTYKGAFEGIGTSTIQSDDQRRRGSSPVIETSQTWSGQ